MSSQKQKKPLSQTEVKQALVHIESLNLPLVDIDFKALCNSIPEVFGPPFQKQNNNLEFRRRRHHQNLFLRLKKKTISEYVAFLEKHDVPPSSCTHQLLMTMKSSNTNLFANATPESFRERRADESPSEYESDNFEESEDDESEAAPSPPARKSTPGRHYATRSSKGGSTDPEDIDFNAMSLHRTYLPPTPDRKPKARTTSRSRDSSTRNRSVTRISHSRTPSRRTGTTHELEYWAIPRPEDSPNGTSTKPWIIHFDKDRMENHGIFQIISCDQVTYVGHQYTVLEFRRQIALGDVGSWEANLDDPRIPPDYKGRCVLVTGPSIDEFSKDPERSDSKWPDPSQDAAAAPVRCVKAFEERKRQLAAIELDDSRKKLYYLIVCPADIILDNNIFCHNKKRVQKIAKDMRKDHPARQGEHHTASWANFRIAHSGGVVYEQAAAAPVYSNAYD
jgi:hypothetical protein